MWSRLIRGSRADAQIAHGKSNVYVYCTSILVCMQSSFEVLLAREVLLVAYIEKVDSRVR